MLVCSTVNCFCAFVCVLTHTRNWRISNGELTYTAVSVTTHWSCCTQGELTTSETTITAVPASEDRLSNGGRRRIWRGLRKREAVPGIDMVIYMVHHPHFLGLANRLLHRLAVRPAAAVQRLYRPHQGRV